LRLSSKRLHFSSSVIFYETSTNHLEGAYIKKLWLALFFFNRVKI
jgi:hypothetical protein